MADRDRVGGGWVAPVVGRAPGLALATPALLASLVVLGWALTQAGDVGACGDLNILELEIAGSEERAADLLRACGREDAGSVVDATARDFGGLHRGLHWDSWVAVPLYVLVLSSWCWCTHWKAPPRSRTGRGLLRLGVTAAVLAGLFDLIENHFLRLVLRDNPTSGSASRVAFATAVPKFVLVGFAAVVALGGLVHVVRRLRAPLATRASRSYRSAGAGAWDRAFDIPDRPGPDAVGIACSGGGIRSASFCMGGLQAFSDPELPWPGTNESFMRRTDRIASVSGGGYLAGARQLLLHQGRPVPFAEGSYEEDFVRRHGRYLADSAGEWLAAGARILAGLVLNLGLLWLLLYAVARPVGWLQSGIFPVSCDEQSPGACIKESYDLEAHHFAAPALAAGVAIVLVLLFVLGRAKTDTSVPFSRGDLMLRGAAVAAIAAAGTATVTLLVPAVAGGMRELLDLGGDTAARNRNVVAGSTSILAMVATGFRLVAGRVGSVKAALEKKGADDGPGSKPGWTKRLALMLAGLALAVFVIVLFAGFVQDARGGPNSETLLGWSDVRAWLIVVGFLGVLYWRADQTTWSLHTIYRRRLNTAFALTPTATGVEELSYACETTLSTMAAPVEGEPKLVLCAAANLSGSDVAPPGRRAVTFTFEHDWIGGPQLGYTATKDYESSLPKPVKGDTTLLAAMAISGAAVASAMGRHSLGSVNSLLAVFNIRLGVWLPTPEFADQVTRGREHARGSRRFTYLFREIFGLYDSAEAYTYVSDGGHYENLGVVELLRRRCSVVFCFDASGGPATLVEAMQLAETELGARITLPKDALHSVRAQPAESADGHEPPAALAGRLARGSVIVGTIDYPAVEEIGPRGTTSLPAATGVFIYGRAVLTKDTPVTVAEHASGNVRFPNDPTGDQWFDADQFDNYLLLGRHVGQQMAAALQAVVAAGVPPPQPVAPSARHVTTAAGSGQRAGTQVPRVPQQP
ncbi:MAG: hypothetical protein WKF43_09780 [Acidimicrobiales bacterium]